MTDNDKRLALIRTISATANKGRQEPDATRRCLSIVEDFEREARLDELKRAEEIDIHVCAQVGMLCDVCEYRLNRKKQLEGD